MKAKDAMTSPVVSVLPDTSLAEVAQLMLGKGIGSALVTLKSSGRLVVIPTRKSPIKVRPRPVFSDSTSP